MPSAPASTRSPRAWAASCGSPAQPGGGPVRAGIAVADVGAGLHCAIGILIALLEREVSGEGQWVSSSLLQAMISMCDFQAARWTIAKDVPGQAGNNHPTGIPTGVFKTSDGYINIAASGDHIYKRFCDSIKAPELLTDERFSSAKARVKNRDVLNEEIDKRLADATSAEWVEKLNKAGVPAGPIYKMDEMFADPQVKHLKMAHPVKHPKLGEIEVIGQAINMSRTPFEIGRRRRSRASIPTPCSRRSATTTRPSPSFRQRGVI